MSFDEEDAPVFDPQCPKCGRFFGKGTAWINGFGEVVRTEATCSRCGAIEPVIVCWQSDLEYARHPSNGRPA